MQGIRIIAAAVIVLLFTCGCATRDIDSTGIRDRKAGEEIAEDEMKELESPPDERDEAEDVYDIEKELPENRELKETEKIEENIVIREKDSVVVEELAATSSGEKSHGLGYRVQIFASEDPAKAREIKRSALEKISLNVYIDYENNMYKVRVGDFASRDEAAEMRKSLKEFYPDCWITETTIRK